MNEQNTPYFPLFVDLQGKHATIIGGGDTACRKAKMLLKFGAKVRIIAPEISDETAKLVRENKAAWLDAKFAPELLEGTDLLVAATNQRAVNHAVSVAAKEQRILVCVSDCREESSFVFPTVLQNDTIVAGIVTTEIDVHAAKRILEKLKEKLGIR